MKTLLWPRIFALVSLACLVFLIHSWMGFGARDEVGVAAGDPAAPVRGAGQSSGEDRTVHRQGAQSTEEPVLGIPSVLGLVRDDAWALERVQASYSLGRARPLRAQALSAVPGDLLTGRTKGAGIRLPWPGGREVDGRVQTAVVQESGLQVLAGKIVAPLEGFFHLELLDGSLHGRMGFKGKDTVALIFPVEPGLHAFVEQRRDLTMCRGAEQDIRDFIGGVFSTNLLEALGNLDPWNLQSFPGAAGVVLLDFNGHTVENTTWNTEFTDGAPIVAQPFDVFNPSSAQYKPEYMLKVFNRCKEDFSPFNINVTTSHAVFNAATPGRRQRVIITPTEAWYPENVGGVAYRFTFTLNSDTPCWAWNGGIDFSMPETISHEVGHTLGLGHSGHQTSTSGFSEYYSGHGVWAPIMGNSFSGQRSYTLWDNGFYKGATSTENQIAIIAATGTGTNNFGMRVDDHGGTQATSTVITANASGVIRASGRIERDGDVDVYRFAMPAGTFDILGASHDPGPNAYLKLTLRDSAYSEVKSIVTAGSQPAHGTHLSPGPAAYYLEVTNIGRAAASGDQGFPSYGARGNYSLELTEPGGDDLRPVVDKITVGTIVFGYDSLFITAEVSDNKAIRVDTLATGDLRVSKGATTWTPVLVSAVPSSQGPNKIWTTFRFTPPGGFWDTGDAGTYTASFLAGAVADTYGNTNLGVTTTTFELPAIDSNLPKIYPPDPWPSTVLGDTGYEFEILYSDVDTAFAVGSFDGGDLEVRASDGSVLPVALVEKSAANFNRSVAATYRVTPPGGAWDVDDTAIYTVKVRAGEVLGATGSAMAETVVGSFTHFAELLFFDISTNPGFALGPGWAWGTPSGAGGMANGIGRDPASGFTGAQVLGTNLNGNYAASAAVTTATSPVFSTIGYQKLSVNYRKWLNAYDPVAVEYRVGSGAWKNLWLRDSEIDVTWSEARHPLPPECDHQAQVQLRWSIGPTAAPSSLRPLGGWNIDDIRLLTAERFAPGRVLISWSPIGRFSLTEGGSSRFYLLKLDQDPGAATPVTVSLFSPRGSGDLTHPTSVVIDSTNWSTGRVVNVSAPQNTLVDGSRTTSLRHTLVSANPHFSGLVGPPLVVSIFDDDDEIIRTQPADRTLPQGTPATLGVTTNSLTGTLSYQWYSGETGNTARPVTGATTANLNVTVGSGTGHYWVRVVRRLSSLSTFVEDSRTALVAPLTGYAAWKHALLSQGYTQPQIDAPDFDAGDPERDGLTHLMEYALGGHPSTMDAALMPRLVMQEDGPHFLFRRARADVEYSVQLADDPRSAWADFATNPGSVDPAADQDFLLPASNALARFARLRISR